MSMHRCGRQSCSLLGFWRKPGAAGLVGQLLAAGDEDRERGVSVLICCGLLPVLPDTASAGRCAPRCVFEALFSQVLISVRSAASFSYLLFFQAYKQLSRFTNVFPGLHAALPRKPRGLCVGSSLLRAGAVLRCPLGVGDGVPGRKLGELGALQGQLGELPRVKKLLKSFLTSSWASRGVSVGMQVELSAGLELSLSSGKA